MFSITWAAYTTSAGTKMSVSRVKFVNSADISTAFEMLTSSYKTHTSKILHLYYGKMLWLIRNLFVVWCGVVWCGVGGGGGSRVCACVCVCECCVYVFVNTEMNVDMLSDV